MKRIIKAIFLTAFICLPISVLATSGDITINCPSKANPKDIVSCTMSITASGGTINGISANYDLQEGLTYNSMTPNSAWVQNLSNISTGFALGNTNGVAQTTQIGTLKVNVSSNATPGTSLKVNLKNISVSDTQTQDVETTINYDTIKIASDNNNLTALSVTGTTINFNSNTTTYDLIVNNSSTTISATKADSNATITGLGTKTLKYGLNTIKVVVKAENNTTKTYKLNITRPDTRSTENRLASLSLTNGAITFSPDVTEYNALVETNVSSTTISATLKDQKASFETEYGPKTITLKYGINTIYLKVKSEKGTTKTYTLKITRKDDRSTENNLSTLTISSTTLLFNSTVLEYNVEVEKDVTSVEINATPVNKAATFQAGYGPRKVELKPGLNVAKIIVKSEKGTTKTFTLNITRKDERNGNNSLKSITLSSGPITFDKDTLNYDVSVPFETEKITIEAVAEDKVATLKYQKEQELQVGENTITIKVIAQNNSEKIYTIKVIRKGQGEGLSNESKLFNIVVEGQTIPIKAGQFTYQFATTKDKLNLTATPANQNANVVITGNENLKEGSIIKIIVTAEDQTTSEYQLEITSQEKTNILPIILVIGGGILVAIIIIIIIKKKKQPKEKTISATMLNNNQSVQPSIPTQTKPVQNIIPPQPQQNIVKPQNVVTTPTPTIPTQPSQTINQQQNIVKPQNVVTTPTSTIQTQPSQAVNQIPTTAQQQSQTINQQQNLNNNSNNQGFTQ